MAIGKRKASQIAKRYVSALITYYDPFYSESLSAEENQLVHNECMKIALRIFNGDNKPTTDEIVKDVLK